MLFFFFLRRSKFIKLFFVFSSRRRHTRCYRDWSSDVCSSDLGPIGEGRYQHTRRHAGEELIEPGGVEAAEMPFRLAVGLVPESSGLGRGSPRREAAMGGQSREEPAQAQSIGVGAATLPVQQGARADADERRQVGGCKGGASAQAGQPLTKSACIVGRAGHRYAILSTSPAGARDRGEAGVSAETLPNMSTIVTRSHFGFSLHLTSFHTFIVACVLPITHGARRLPGPVAPCAARRWCRSGRARSALTSRCPPPTAAPSHPRRRSRPAGCRH